MEEIKTDSINLIATANDGGQSVLVIALKDSYRDKPQYTRYLRREYDKNKDLDNPNIFHVKALKEVEGCGLAIVTEWEDSRTLAQWLKEGEHSDDEKKRVVRQVADALSYMHSQGVIHGALNAANIYITRKGDNVKLLTIHQRYADILKQPNDTLKYLAPEAKDGTVGLNERADIYSLGVLLKEMGLDMEYHSVIETCCHFGRNERFDSIDSFLEALNRRHYTRTPAAEHTAAAASVSTNKRMAIIVAIIVVLVGIAIALLVAQGGSNDDTPEATEQTDTTTQTDQQQQAAEQPAPAAQPATTDTAQANQQPAADQQPTDEANADDNAFLKDLVPQMQADIDKIYAEAPDPATARRKVAIYYNGLRKVLRKRHLKIAQLDAFDKAFAAYNAQKKQQ